MRIYINKLFLPFLVILLLGCTDLEETPTSLISPEGFYKTPADVETVTRGAYATLSHTQMWGDRLPLYLWMSSDMVGNSGFGALGGRESYDFFPVDPGLVHVADMWRRFFEIISTANSAIEGASFLDLPEEEIRKSQASARFIRGYAYSFLARIWGQAPYIDQFVRETDEIKDIKSSTETFLLSKVIEDFQFAKDHLPDSDLSIRSLPTKGTAASFLAWMHLYTGDYAKAYTEAKWVIDNSSTYNYNLEPEFEDLWIEAKQDQLTEPIFVVDYIAALGGQENMDWMGPLTTVRGSSAGGWGLAVPEVEVFMSWNDGDYRKDVSMLDSMTFNVDNEPVLQHWSTFPIPPRPHIEKWVGRYDPATTPVNGFNSGFNLPLMRYAEILLIAAEAGAEANGVSAEVEGYVNQVRARARRELDGDAANDQAFPADVSQGMSKDAFIDLVMDERRLELAFEFRRWWDIKRRDLGDELFKNDPNRLEDRPNFDKSRDYYLYIPASDLSINPNLSATN